MPTDQPTDHPRHALVRLHDGRLDLRSGLVTPRITRLLGTHAEVSLLATTATLLAGDELHLRIEVGPDQTLRLTDVAATVAYAGRGGSATIDVSITVAAGGTLVWSAEPLVLAEGAHVRRALRADVADGGRLLLRDQLVLGRTGEPGGRLECRTRISLAGRAALAEDLTLTADDPGDPAVGIVGTSRVLDSAVAVGWRPPSPEHGTEFVWELPGALVRDLAPQAHLSAIRPAWEEWTRALADVPAEPAMTVAQACELS